jgi:hypothetical protein
MKILYERLQMFDAQDPFLILYKCLKSEHYRTLLKPSILTLLTPSRSPLLPMLQCQLVDQLPLRNFEASRVAFFQLEELGRVLGLNGRIDLACCRG